MIKIKATKHNRLGMSLEETTYQVISSQTLDAAQLKHLRDARVLGGGQSWRASPATTKKVGKRTFYVYHVVDHSDSGD